MTEEREYGALLTCSLKAIRDIIHEARNQSIIGYKDALYQE
jgi:hypothetical protein